MDQSALQGRERLERRSVRHEGLYPAGTRKTVGVRRENDADRARHPARQPRTRQDRLARRGARAQRHPRRVPGAAHVDGLLPERRLHRGDAQHHLRLGGQKRALPPRDGKRRLQRAGDAVLQTADGARVRLCGRTHLLEPLLRGTHHGLEAAGRGGGRVHPPAEQRRGGAGRHRVPARTRTARPS